LIKRDTTARVSKVGVNIIFMDSIVNSKIAEAIDWIMKYFIFISVGFLLVGLAFRIAQKDIVFISRATQILSQEFLTKQKSAVNEIVIYMKIRVLIFKIPNCKFGLYQINLLSFLCFEDIQFL